MNTVLLSAFNFFESIAWLGINYKKKSSLKKRTYILFATGVKMWFLRGQSLQIGTIPYFFFQIDFFALSQSLWPLHFFFKTPPHPRDS